MSSGHIIDQASGELYNISRKFLYLTWLFSACFSLSPDWSYIKLCVNDYIVLKI